MFERNEEKKSDERLIKGRTESDADYVLHVKHHKKLMFFIYDEDFGRWSRISTDKDSYVLEDFDDDIGISYDCM